MPSFENEEDRNTSNKKEIKLKVATAYPKDVNRGIVRLDKKIMEELGILPGDIVEIIGTRNTAADAWPVYPEDEGLRLIRMDGTIRKNAGVSLGDEVVVRKAEVREAKIVVIVPIDPIILNREFLEWLHKMLIGRPVVRCDYIKVTTEESEYRFIVIETEPRGIVEITKSTILADPQSSNVSILL